MSDHDKAGPEQKSLPLARESGEQEAGEGARSLANWERLAAARRDVATSDKARSLAGDPKAFLASYGIDSEAFLKSPGGQLGLSALERQLAFSGGIGREQLGVHRCASVVVGPVVLAGAVAIAGAIALAGAAVGVATVAAAANAGAVANAVAAWNALWSQNAIWASGTDVD